MQMAGQASRAVKFCGTEQVDPPSRMLILALLVERLISTRVGRN